VFEEKRRPDGPDLGLNRPDGYLLRLIPHRHRPSRTPAGSRASSRYASIAREQRRPWPASLGCTTNSYSSIKSSSANASGASRLPLTVPYPTPASAAERPSQIPRTSSAFQSTRVQGARHDVLLCRVDRPGEGSIQSGLAPVRAAETLPPSFRKSPGQRGEHRPRQGFFTA